METPNFSEMLAQYEQNAIKAFDYLRSVLEVDKPVEISIDVVSSSWLVLDSVKKNAEGEVHFFDCGGTDCPISNVDVVEAALQVQKKLKAA